MLKDISRDKVKTRLLNVGSYLKQREDCRVKLSVRKWLAKQDRGAEIALIERLMAFRIGSNLANVLKHGIRGRNHDCAVIDHDVIGFEQTGKVSAPGDPAISVTQIVNYKGDLFQLSTLIEDIMFMWVLFLRYHTVLNLQDFYVRLVGIFISRSKMIIYSAPAPIGLKERGKREAERRKQLDI